MNLKEGSTLQDNRYIINKVIGQGGFGITYEGYDSATSRIVCIKEFFMRNLCGRDSVSYCISVSSDGAKEVVAKFKNKFIKEAKILSELSDKSIVSIFDVFEENGTAYYVMEYLNNGSLKDLIENKGPLTEKEALVYINQICDALVYIHGKKIMHLDIKPSNIMIRERDKHSICLIDFGISKHYDNDNEQTSSSPVGRSKGYAPMEQYNDNALNTFSPATDIYSLGATLFYLLTGENPPEANVIFEQGKILILANISKKTKKAIIKAMMPRRQDRYQSVNDFRVSLGIENDEANKKKTFFPPKKEKYSIEKEKPILINENTIINKKWKWYYWAFFPIIYIIDAKKKGKALFHLLFHPIFIITYVILLNILIKDSIGMKILYLSTQHLPFLIFSGFYIACIIASFIFPFATKDIANFYDITRIKRWVFTIIYALSFGSLFSLSIVCCVPISLIVWGIYKLNKQINIHKIIKIVVNIWLIINILLFLYIGIVAYGILFLDWS